METIKAAIYSHLANDNPMTLRQLFYRLVSAGVVRKTEQEYKATVGRLLRDLRRDGEVPYDWITDNTRWMRKGTTYSGPEGFLRSTAQTYRRAVWDDQPTYVEVWLEKDALAGVLLDVTLTWDVPLMVTRGYASETYLYSAAEKIKDVGKPTFIYYLGDHDPSGIDIPIKVEAALRRFVPEAEIHFERLAVNIEQIAKWNLPTRPTKKSDSRARGFKGESVEVDAIAPADLKHLVQWNLEQHVPAHELVALQQTEAAERELLVAFASQWGKKGKQ